MRKLDLYVETSVWNFLFADDAPDKKEATEKFFSEVAAGKYEIYISEVVVAEISAAKPEKQEMLNAMITKYIPTVLEEQEEVVLLAMEYIKSGILSRKHFPDLLHLAYASANGLKAIISWNQKHLVKMKTYNLANSVNLALGYHGIQIWNPQEVIENEGI